MVSNRTVPWRGASPGSVERTLAGALVVLLGLYALGALAEGRVGPIHDAGVLAVHLALVVGLALPATVICHAGLGRLDVVDSRPTRAAVAVATVLLGTLVAAIVLTPAEFPEPVVWTLVGGLLLLAGLVLARR